MLLKYGLLILPTNNNPSLKYPCASTFILHFRYLGPILDKLRAGECFRAPLQQQADQPSQANAPVDEDVAAEASRVNSHNGAITDILELHRYS